MWAFLADSNKKKLCLAPPHTLQCYQVHQDLREAEDPLVPRAVEAHLGRREVEAHLGHRGVQEVVVLQARQG